MKILREEDPETADQIDRAVDHFIEDMDKSDSERARDDLFRAIMI